jgi:hypothetical protein
MEIQHARQGQPLYSFHDDFAKLAAHADFSGHLPPGNQEGLIQSLGMNGCYDPSQEPTHDQLQLLTGIVTQLKQNYYQIPNFYWTVVYTASNTRCLNSSSWPPLRIVFFYRTMGNALRWDRDAIAAVIAHEVGHLVDKYCGTIGQNIIATAGSTMLQQVCEKHADNIGIQYVVGAGFNPNGFVSTFQTLQRYAPTATSTRYSANHPINADRITNVGLALRELCKENIPQARQWANPDAPGPQVPQ